MLIFNAAHGDPMLCDSTLGLRQLHERVVDFANSGAAEALFPAITASDPAPYTELLAGLRVRRSSLSPQLHISADGWLELSASSAGLKKFADRLLVPEDGNHSHWRSSPVSLIIEADEWRAHAS